MLMGYLRARVFLLSVEVLSLRMHCFVICSSASVYVCVGGVAADRTE